MAKPLHVILISFILLMMPLAGCIDGEEKIEEEETIDQEPAVVVKGCMDNNSANYNPNATEDDNSCMALLPKDALIALYESWGSHMYTPILDEDDSRVGVELTITSTEEVMFPEDLKDDSQSGRSTEGSHSGIDPRQISWEGTRTSVVRDVPNLSPDTLKDDSGAYVITSVISDGTVLRHSDNTTNETEDTVIKQSVRYGDDVVVRTSGAGGKVLIDGTYVRDNHDTRTTDTRPIMEYIIEETKPLRAPTCVEYYGVGTCGTWPACYEPVPGTDCSGQQVVDRGGGQGWAVGMYAYQACELEGGTWIHTDPDPVGNPNVGYCIWSIAPLDDVFGTNPVADGFDFLDAKIGDADINYLVSEDQMPDSWEGGLITFTFNFADEQLGFKITLTADDHRIAAFSSISVFESGDDTTITEVFEMKYLMTHKDMEDDNEITATTRAAPDGTTGYPWLDQKDDFGYYHYCSCSCAPSGGMWVWMLHITSANNVPIICLNACANLCGNTGGGSGDHPFLDEKFRTDGTKSGTIGNDVYDIIEKTSIAPPSLALEFECYHNDEKSQTIPLEAVQDGVEDCSTSADEDFDTENGVTFVISEKQVINPSISSMSVRFMSMTEGGSSVVETIDFTIPSDDEESNDEEGDDEISERSAESNDEEDQNEVERQVIYYDLDGDGKISSGDMISLTFPSDEFIQFVDNSRGETVAIHGDEDTTAVIYRDMTCQEQFGENVCENYVSFYDASTGEWYSIRMCFMKPEGEDCNGTPISDS